MVKKAFKNALLVQIISAIVGVIGMMVDGAVTGSCLGTAAMTGFGLATPVVLIFAACSGVCELGASILVGRLVGARKEKEAAVALSSCVAFALALSLVLGGAVYAFSRPVAAFLGAAGPIVDETADYLKGFALCAPALLLLTTLMPVMQIQGKQKTVILAVLLMTAVNVTGDLLVGLVFKGGLFGMALATAVSYYAALLLELPVLLGKGNAIRVSFRHLRFDCVRTMILGGLPSALPQVCRSLLMFIMNWRILAIADAQTVAAFAVVRSAANLCMVPGSGIGTSVSVLTGVFAGDRDERSIRSLVRLGLRTAVSCSAVLWLLLFSGAGLLVPLFTSDPALAQLAVPGFRLFTLSMMGYTINVTLHLYYQAMKFSALSYAYGVASSFLFPVIGVFVLSAAFGVSGVWLSNLFGEVLTLLALLAWVLATTENKGTLLDRAMLIPAALTEGILCRFDGEAGDSAGMVRLSEQVRAFCTEHGADGRTAFALSLCAEELGVYVLNRNGARGRSVEVRVLHTGEGWSMNVRDNGRPANPLELLKEAGSLAPERLLKEECPDDFSFVGLKLACDMSRKIEYFDTLNINNLRIVV